MQRPFKEKMTKNDRIHLTHQDVCVLVNELHELLEAPEETLQTAVKIKQRSSIRSLNDNSLPENIFTLNIEFSLYIPYNKFGNFVFLSF